MKRYIIFILLLSIFAGITAQDRGSYLTIGAGVGPSGLNYDLQGISSEGKDKIKVGGNALIGYSYFFTRHWGLGTGVGLSYYRSQGQYNNDFSANDYYDLGHQVDPTMSATEPLHDYNLRVRLANWRENQTAYYIDVPLMIQYQHKFGASKVWGIYAGVGAKVQFPLSASYEVEDGKYESDSRINVSGKTPSSAAGSNIDYGAPGNPALPYHGFGYLYNPNEKLGWNGDMDLKMSITGVADFGFLYKISPRVDLMLGGYFDYGFSDVKPDNTKDKALMQAPVEYNPAANNNVGNGIAYSGVVNSDRVDKANLVSYGGKIGVRVQLCKAGKPDVKTIVKHDTIYAPPRIDTVYIQPKRAVINNDSVERLLRSLLDTVVAIKKRQAEIPKHINRFEEIDFTDTTVVVIPIVEFDVDSYRIREKESTELDDLAVVLKRQRNVLVYITGHTDSDGSDAHNLLLSQNRALSVKRYLENKGVDLIIITDGKGESQPIDTNSTPEGKQHNRRIEFRFSNRLR